MRNVFTVIRLSLTLGLFPFLLPGCQENMERQAKVSHWAPSPFFTDKMSARLPVEGTWPRHIPPAETPPLLLDEGLIARGRDRYRIFCLPCHGPYGWGDGIIVERGLTPPPSFHSNRLKLATDRHFFEVITHGLGAMYGYADRIEARDRWAVVAYIKSLQRGLP